MKSIIVVHQPGDGANFLISCLSMSDDVYYYGFSKKEKIRHYSHQILNQNLKWTDPVMWSLCLTSKKIYNTDNFTNFLNKEINSKFIFTLEYPFNIILDGNLNQQNKIIKFIDKLVSNGSQFILFENPVTFFCVRNFFDENCTSNIFRYDVSCHPDGFYPKDDFLNNLSIKQYFNLPDDSKKYFEEKYSLSIYDIISRNYAVSRKFENIDLIKKQHKYFEKDNNYVWNVNWYLSEENTIINIKKLYDFLNLGGYDEKIIQFMYKLLINKLNQIKTKNM